jgi:hypothetical protein
MYSEFEWPKWRFFGTIINFTFAYIPGTFVTKRRIGFNSATYLPALHELYSTVLVVSILQLTNSLYWDYGEYYVYGEYWVYGEYYVGLLI